MDTFLGVLFMLSLVFGTGVAYKKRCAIGRWLNDPQMAVSGSLQHKRKVLRRRIEDAEEELEMLDEIDATNKGD